ncbi:hypothetical protein [Sphingosinicella sp. CPCC 101087]|uniref:hypothetical protein n=1 Tax=Sphingosinicella sp. CPCC 101087 TaxID=2497754 RepID=UPI00101CA228|nr:hypothetical protein [Sphingosinicella sp. CPCC 101087]
MTEHIVQVLIHIVAVSVGLYLLWSLVGAMRSMGRPQRLLAALTAGLISGAVVLVVRLAL